MTLNDRPQPGIVKLPMRAAPVVGKLKQRPVATHPTGRHAKVSDGSEAIVSAMPTGELIDESVIGGMGAFLVSSAPPRRTRP